MAPVVPTGAAGWVRLRVTAACRLEYQLTVRGLKGQQAKAFLATPHDGRTWTLIEFVQAEVTLFPFLTEMLCGNHCVKSQR